MGKTVSTYQTRLQAIGARLDAGGFHTVSILEVEGGLIVRATAPGERTPQVIEIADNDETGQDENTRAPDTVPHRLFPNGYRQFLAALGNRLDQGRAAAIAIVEGTDFVTVGGIQPVSESTEGVAYEPLDILLLPDDINEISRQPLSRSRAASRFQLPIADLGSVSGRSQARATQRLTSILNSFLRVVQFG
ncbi:MAG: hypothetical protein R3A46_08790 [Thermomicrobiales bacterium]